MTVTEPHHTPSIATENCNLSNTLTDLEIYQKLWEAQLPNHPLAGIICVGVTITVFIGFICFPWIMAFMQDEGWIHPHIDLPFRNLEPASYNQPMESPPFQKSAPANASTSINSSSSYSKVIDINTDTNNSTSGIELFGKPRQLQ